MTKWTIASVLEHLAALRAADNSRYESDRESDIRGIEQRFKDQALALDLALQTASTVIETNRSTNEKLIKDDHTNVLGLREADNLRNEQRFIAQERAVEAALYSARTATEKAETAAERRFESVNEFRAALSSQQSTYITRSEVYTLMALACAIASALGGIVGHYIK